MARPPLLRKLAGEPGRVGRVALVACSKVKLTPAQIERRPHQFDIFSPVGRHAVPAQELYQGQLFKLSRAWLESKRPGKEWAILSAKHGLVLPEQMIEPYDLALGDLTWEQQKRWGQRVRSQLAALWGIDDVIYLILAGESYRHHLHLPMSEDVFGHWARERKARGTRGRMGIGVLKQMLKRGASYP